MSLALNPASKLVVGMIHAAAMPGTPRATLVPREIAQAAAAEAELLTAAGVDALLIENMHDVPYTLGPAAPEVVACMTAAALSVRSTSSLPLGVQVLAGANREALAVALATEATFIRIEGFVFAHVADEGLMATAQAGELLRYRRGISAGHIRVIADIKKKHAAHAMTSDIALPDMAKAAEFFGADGVIVTGSATGQPAQLDDLRGVRSATTLPVWVGSGARPDNLAAQWPFADAFIVGSYFKRDGRWDQPLSKERIDEFMSRVRALRSSADSATGVTSALTERDSCSHDEVSRIIRDRDGGRT